MKTGRPAARRDGAAGARALRRRCCRRRARGKLLRRSIQALCEGRDPGDLTTIEDPTALQQIRDCSDRRCLSESGVARHRLRRSHA